MEKFSPGSLEFSSAKHTPGQGVMDNDAFYLSPSLEASIVKYNTIVSSTQFLLSILGEAGSGKTTLCEHYQTASPDNWIVCQVGAEDLTTPHKLLEHMEAGFPGSAMGSDKQGLQKLIMFWQSAAQNMQIPVLLIDDAHLLSDRLLETLFRLHKLRGADDKNLVRIILLSEHSLIERFNSCEGLQVGDKDLVEKDLPAFTLEEIAQYLGCRAKVSGADTVVSFSSAEISSLKRQSNGLPGALNELADELSGNKALNVVLKKQLSKRLLTTVGTFASIALIAFLTYSLVYTPVDESQSIVLDLPINEQTIPSQQAKVNPELVEEFMVPILQNKLNAPVDPISAETLSEALSEPSVEPESVELPADAVVSVMDIEPQVQVQVKENLEEEARKGVKENIVEQKVKGVTVQSWINNRSPGSYTIQLIASSNKQKILEFIKQSKMENQLIYFHTKKVDKDWYAVVQGEYATFAESENARKGLSKQLSTYGPWVRRFSTIQKEISLSAKNVNLIDTSFASNE